MMATFAFNELIQTIFFVVLCCNYWPCSRWNFHVETFALKLFEGIYKSDKCGHFLELVKCRKEGRLPKMDGFVCGIKKDTKNTVFLPNIFQTFCRLR